MPADSCFLHLHPANHQLRYSNRIYKFYRFFRPGSRTNMPRRHGISKKRSSSLDAEDNQGLKEGNYSNVVLFSILVVAETLVLFVLTLCGESITVEAENLGNALYYSKWYNLNVPNRKTLLNIHTVMCQPVVISALGLVDLNMDTFSSIMNASYSFFNIMGSQMG